MADIPENENLIDAVQTGVRETEAEILNEAFIDPPEDGDADEADTQDQTDAQDASSDRPRDEKGKFVAKDAAKQADQQTPEQQKAAEGEQAGEKGDKDDGETVPRWRLREIAEERRQAQAERDQLRAELIRLQTQQQTRQPPQSPAQGLQQQPQQENQEIDPLLDPVGFANRLRSEFAQQLATQQLNFSLSRAHDRHGEVFEKAYEALVTEGQRGNGAIVRDLTSRPNPGEAIVTWHKQQMLLRETNGDLDAYKSRVREELLQDPEFLKQAMETARGQATGGQRQPTQGQRPNTITRLPPSLSRTAGSSANVDPIDTDDSDDAIFAFATQR
jgi:hypothetical protein